jgi:hypothetical protein
MQENIINSATQCGGGVLDSSLAAESSESPLPATRRNPERKNKQKNKSKPINKTKEAK